MGDLHALADAVSAAGPAGIDQPAVGAVLGDLLAQQLAVDRRVARHERRPETGREDGLGLLDALDGAGDHGGVAGKEVIHRLFGAQPADRRQHPEGVGRQHEDVLRVAADAFLADKGNEIDGVGRAGVLGQRGVVEIDHPRRLVDDDVLEDGAEAPRGGVDLGLGLGREADHLGVATAFEVEHAVVAPAVLVIADQRPCAVGRERRLAGAGQAEEDGGVPLFADIGRAVHGQDAPGRQQVVEDGEHRFLDLAGVGAAADQHQLLVEADLDEDLGVGAVLLGLGVAARRLDDGELGLEGFQFLVLRADEHVGGEEAVPGGLGDNAHRQAELRIGAGVAVLNEHVPALVIGQQTFVQAVEIGRRGRPVDRAPPDVVVVFGLIDDELVLGRASGVDAREHDQCPALGQNPFAAAHRLFTER